MVEAAGQVFAQRGFRAASMDEIAGRVGVTKPMLYEYFGSKDGLLVACVARAQDELSARTELAHRSSSDPERRVREGVRAFFDFVTDHATAWSVLRSEPALDDGPAGGAVGGAVRQRGDQLAAVLATCPHLAEMPGSRLAAYADVVVGACERLAARLGSDRELGPAEATDVVMDALWHGLGGAP
jgi:AcrR family transcriptional regulator